VLSRGVSLVYCWSVEHPPDGLIMAVFLADFSRWSAVVNLGLIFLGVETISGKLVLETDRDGFLPFWAGFFRNSMCILAFEFDIYYSLLLLLESLDCFSSN